MKLSRLLMAISGSMLFSFATAADNADLLKPFPEATADETRYVIELPKLPNEENVKVQLIAGKTVEVDCNRQSFGGEISEENIEGWGYSFYKISELVGPMTTLMGCPEDSKHDAFVPMQDSPLVRYNSNLPLVIYAPKDVEVKYRIWQADVLEMNAPEK